MPRTPSSVSTRSTWRGADSVRLTGEDIVKVGFIGLGVMGGHMARHLAGRYELTVFDVDAAKMGALEAAVAAEARGSSTTVPSSGARCVASVAAVGAACELVLLSLPSSEIVEAVVTGEGGLREHMPSGGAVIDTSTTDPLVSKRIAARLAEHGIGFLDAPVSGGEGGAKAATLSIMVGGPAELFDRCQPVLEVLGASVVRVGEVGAGGVAKLVNNMIVGAEFAVIAESFALAKRMGLEVAQLYQAIRCGWAASAVLEVAAPGIIARDFAPGGSVDLLFKDLGYALQLARSENVPTPMTAAADEIFKAARASGRGPQAQQVIIQLWGSCSGWRSSRRWYEANGGTSPGSSSCPAERCRWRGRSALVRGLIPAGWRRFRSVSGGRGGAAAQCLDECRISR